MNAVLLFEEIMHNPEKVESIDLKGHMRNGAVSIQLKNLTDQEREDLSHLRMSNINGSLFDDRDMKKQKAVKDIEKALSLGAPDGLEKETLLLAKESIKKQIPIEHHHTKIADMKDGARLSVCPECLSVICTGIDEYPRFCTWCGQAILWGKP